jgi:hypothetical protein
MTASDHLPVVADYRLPPILRGDDDGTGQVEQADLDLVLLHCGQVTPPSPGGWLHDLPTDAIDQQELDQVLLRWGTVAAGVEQAPVVAEPELSAVSLRVVACLCVASRYPRA